MTRSGISTSFERAAAAAMMYSVISKIATTVVGGFKGGSAVQGTGSGPRPPEPRPTVEPPRNPNPPSSPSSRPPWNGPVLPPGDGSGGAQLEYQPGRPGSYTRDIAVDVTEYQKRNGNGN